ncbi:hypothetical protein C8R45DRAFT_1039005 [Mycena sanguinolenta]|nr:hypothetical protein C8R45DRAFT_1039005 [Mycena sanguinolenta]
MSSLSRFLPLAPVRRFVFPHLFTLLLLRHSQYLDTCAELNFPRPLAASHQSSASIDGTASSWLHPFPGFTI